MDQDPLLAPLVEALAGLVRFVDSRPDEATADDDVRALEDVGFRLAQVAQADRPRLVRLLGEELSESVGIIE